MDRREYILQSIKNRSAEIMPMNAKVILFGSQARGDYHEGSDWDILILLLILMNLRILCLSWVG